LVGFSGYFRFLPEFAANACFCRFFRQFPSISAYFQTVLKWTFSVFLRLLQVQPSDATAQVAACSWDMPYILRLPVMVGKRPCNSSSIIFIKSDLCSSAATIGKINTLSFPFTTNLCGLFN